MAVFAIKITSLVCHFYWFDKRHLLTFFNRRGKLMNTIQHIDNLNIETHQQIFFLPITILHIFSLFFAFCCWYCYCLWRYTLLLVLSARVQTHCCVDLEKGNWIWSCTRDRLEFTFSTLVCHDRTFFIYFSTIWK